MQLETKFLRLRTPVTLGSRFGDWQVTWLGGWSRYRLYFLVMVVKFEPPRITAGARRSKTAANLRRWFSARILTCPLWASPRRVGLSTSFGPGPATAWRNTGASTRSLFRNYCGCCDISTAIIRIPPRLNCCAGNWDLLSALSIIWQSRQRYGRKLRHHRPGPAV